MTTLLSLLMQAVSHPAAQALGWTLVHFLWQGLVLGLLAWGVLALLRGARAQVRYGVACAFLLLMVASPVITYRLLQPQAAVQGALPTALHMSGEAAGALDGTLRQAPLTQRMKASLDPALPWLLAGWAAGVLLLSLRFLGSWLRVQRLRRRSAVPVPSEWHLVLSRLCRELKLSRTVRLLQSAAVEVPTALGWLRPVILLPACALAGLSPLQLEAILAHELAHIRRGDFLVNLLQSLVEVLLFYHPAVWWLSARIRSERELCCDDVAAGLCGDPLILARALTDLESLREPITPSPTPLAMAANGGSLMHRVRHLLHPALPITSGARATALAVLAASLLGAAGVAMQDKPKEASEADKATRIRMNRDDRNLNVTMKGDVQINGEAPEPVVVAGDGSFTVEEKKDGKKRVYSAVKDKATYTEDGTEKPVDKEVRDWLRDILRNVKRSQHARERVIDIKMRRLDGRDRELDAKGRAMEAQGRALEAKMRALELKGQSLSDEEQAKLKAEGEKLKTEGEKLKSEGEKFKAEARRFREEADRFRQTPEFKAMIDEARKAGREVHVELHRKGEGSPEAIVVEGEGGGRNHLVKRFKVLEGRKGESGQDFTWISPEDFQGLDIAEDLRIPPIDIPKIRLKTLSRRGETDPKAEMAEIQAELRALQARLDQLQHQISAPPRPPKPPKPPQPPQPHHPPLAPKAVTPAVPAPPPPPAPNAVPAPPDPPAPPPPPSTK